MVMTGDKNKVEEKNIFICIENLSKKIENLTEEIKRLKLIGEENKEILSSLTRQRKEHKEILLLREVKIKKQMSSRDVVNFLNCSKTWAIELMEKLERNNDCVKFIQGERKIQRPALIIFQEKEHLQKIQKHTKEVEEMMKLKKTNSLTFREIGEVFSLKKFEEIKEAVEEITKYNSNYLLDDSDYVLNPEGKGVFKENGFKIVRKKQK